MCAACNDLDDVEQNHRNHVCSEILSRMCDACETTGCPDCLELTTHNEKELCASCFQKLQEEGGCYKCNGDPSVITIDGKYICVDCYVSEREHIYEILKEASWPHH